MSYASYGSDVSEFSFEKKKLDLAKEMKAVKRSADDGGGGGAKLRTKRLI